MIDLDNIWVPEVNKEIVWMVVEGLWNGTAVRRWKGGRGGSVNVYGGKVDHDGSGSRIEWIVAVCFVILLSGRRLVGYAGGEQSSV